MTDNSGEHEPHGWHGRTHVGAGCWCGVTHAGGTGEHQPPADEVYETIKEVAESLGMTVGPLIVPTPEMQQAASDRLELAEVAISEASGDVRPVEIPFDPVSRQNGNAWSDRQDDPLWLLTPAEYEQVPDGATLICISGERKVKGIDYIDQDTRGGWIAWGLLESQVVQFDRNDPLS